MLRFSILLFVVLMMSNCNNEDDTVTPEERKNITTLRFILKPPRGNEVTMSYEDLDGVGGNDPIIEGGTLTANTVYFCDIELLNEAVNPAEDITQTIESEKETHQFFFTINGLDLDFTYADTDNDGNPVGLFTAITTGAPSSGTIVINLQRNLNKFAQGVSEGFIGNGGGSTDIQVTFPVTIE